MSNVSLFPTSTPTLQPTEPITEAPTFLPTDHPTGSPSSGPTLMPTEKPSQSPTVLPTPIPSMLPSSSPSMSPQSAPTASPSSPPSVSPSFQSPTTAPNAIPTLAPSTPSPTTSGSQIPSEHTLGTGAIVGIALGSVVAFLLIVVLLILSCRTRQIEKQMEYGGNGVRLDEMAVNQHQGGERGGEGNIIAATSGVPVAPDEEERETNAPLPSPTTDSSATTELARSMRITAAIDNNVLKNNGGSISDTPLAVHSSLETCTMRTIDIPLDVDLPGAPDSTPDAPFYTTSKASASNTAAVPFTIGERATRLMSDDVSTLDPRAAMYTGGNDEWSTYGATTKGAVMDNTSKSIYDESIM